MEAYQDYVWVQFKKSQNWVEKGSIVNYDDDNDVISKVKEGES